MKRAAQIIFLCVYRKKILINAIRTHGDFASQERNRCDEIALKTLRNGDKGVAPKPGGSIPPRVAWKIMGFPDDAVAQALENREHIFISTIPIRAGVFFFLSEKEREKGDTEKKCLQFYIPSLWRAQKRDRVGAWDKTNGESMRDTVMGKYFIGVKSAIAAHRYDKGKRDSEPRKRFACFHDLNAVRFFGGQSDISNVKKFHAGICFFMTKTN